MLYTLTIEPQWAGSKRNPKRYTLPPSLNARMHWSVRKGVTDEFKHATILACQVEGVKPMQFAKVSLTHWTTRPRDRDNLYASVKSIIDALVTTGVIPDDSDEFMDLTCRSGKVNHRWEECVTVEINGE